MSGGPWFGLVEDAKVKDVDVALLMSRHTTTNNLSLAQFEEMREAWHFGGRQIVHNCGRRNNRSFAFMPRVDQSSDELEVGLRYFGSSD